MPITKQQKHQQIPWLLCSTAIDQNSVKSKNKQTGKYIKVNKQIIDMWFIINTKYDALEHWC